MAIGTLALPTRRAGWLAAAYHYIVALPWHAIKVYPPVLLIASSAAYASSEFAKQGGIFPEPFNIFQAVAFEWVYLGALALAGHKRGAWFYATVVLGALTSALYMFLHAATLNGWLDQFHGSQVALFLFALAHALPLTLVGVSYMLLIHVVQQDEHSKATQDAQAEAAKRPCPHCPHVAKNQLALYAHFKTCPNRPKRQP